jgi:hypothetical protein
MRIEKLLAILALGAMVSCQTKDNLSVSSVTLSDQGQVILTEKTSNTPLTYLADTDPEAWSRLGSVEERIEACNPTQEELDRMSTKALVESIAHYPLNSYALLYNDPDDFIRLLTETSTLHREFGKRQDSADALIDFLAESELKMGVGASRLHNKEVSFGEEMFLEHFAATKEFQNSLSGEESKKLEAIVKSKYIERMSEPEVFSDVSLEPLKKIQTPPVLTRDAGKIQKDFATIGTSRIYTLFGHYLDVLINAEMSAAETRDIYAYVRTNFKDTSRATEDPTHPATSHYNCHSYAWYNRSSSNPYWINAKNNNNVLQLSRYWTNDAYMSCPASQGEVVYYPNGDHSAVKRADGKFISKWGKGPVMIHEPSYCPYTSTNLQYFKLAELPQRSLKINGPESSSMIPIGQICNYYVDVYNPSVTYQWTVESYPGDANFIEPTILSDRMTYSSLSIKFNAPGYYVMRVDSYGKTNTQQTVHIGYDIVSAVAIPQF